MSLIGLDAWGPDTGTETGAASVYCDNTAAGTVDRAQGMFSFLHTSGTRIVDESGRQVLLRGVNLGNWFLLEMWMLGPGHSDIADQYGLEAVLQRRFGGKEKDRLMNLYRENYITERDFRIIKSFDMNVIRLPFWYTLLEDERHPGKIKADGWRWLDKAVALAEKYGLYVILDMHGAPGSQNKWDHSGRADFNRLWSSAAYRARTVRLWKAVARHYRSRKNICAYDLLNEPWGGTEDELKKLNLRCYRAIRAVDAGHIIVFSGYYNRLEFYETRELRELDNVMLTCHFYPGFFGNGKPTVATHQAFINETVPRYRALVQRLGVPLLVGEFNVVLKAAGGGKMMRRYFDTYNRLGWAATMWSYKVFTAAGGIGAGIWGMVTNALPLKAPDFRHSQKKDIERWLRNLSIMKYSVDKDLKHWLTAP